MLNIYLSNQHYRKKEGKKEEMKRLTIPSRANCSSDISSEPKLGERSVCILSSLPSQCPITTIIAADNLISATDAFYDATESVPQ